MLNNMLKLPFHDYNSSESIEITMQKNLIFFMYIKI